MDYVNPQTQTQFNAGLDIALEVSRIIKNCENYARVQNFVSWFNELNILRRRLSSKERSDKKGSEEIENLYVSSKDILTKYVHKVNRKKKISYHLAEEVYRYLSNYEKVLRVYVDKYGYGMPDKDDPSTAAWR